MDIDNVIPAPTQPAPQSAQAQVRPGWSRRILDIVFSVSALFVLSPLFVVIAVLVRATSHGPVLFRQRRVGQGGQQFTLYKFRTMRCGCAGPLLTCAKDRRVTSVGRLLRPLELDELPQFFNIVRGDMTLVGPRPETPGLACRYPPQCRWVFAHRPGLTGPVQLRSQGLAALIEDKDDPESWYLAVLVPRRVALDAQFLSAPTLARTLALITQTAWYMLSSVLRVRQLLKRSPMEAHSHANHHGLLAPRPRPRNAARHAPAASGPAADQGPAR